MLKIRRFNSKSIDKQYNIEEILRKNDIISVARDLGLNIQKSMVPCVNLENHIDKRPRPTMSLNPINNRFKCWVCSDVEGDVIDLVSRYKKVSREKALQYLAIRSEARDSYRLKDFFKKEVSREEVYKQFIDGLGAQSGIGLIAFLSLKGGTGKSLIVNNLSTLTAIISKYISATENGETQKVELIDLDFGKPDQQHMLGIKPKYYLEDIFYNRENDLDWTKIKVDTILDNFGFVSSAPIRKSIHLFYMHKNELIFLINDSNAKVKMADFGGGLSRDDLDFLYRIKNRICVINDEKTSKEALFNLILTVLYERIKTSFRNDSAFEILLENFRNIPKNNFRAEDALGEAAQLDKKNHSNKSALMFYREKILPLKKELKLNFRDYMDLTSKDLKKEIDTVHEKMDELFFSTDLDDEYSIKDKVKIYKEFTNIEREVEKFRPYKERLKEILKFSQYGLIVNKTDPEIADEIQEDLISKVSYFLNQKMAYLGNLRENQNLRNISNYGMPYVIYNSDDDILEDVFGISDNLLGLKNGSTSWIVKEQKPLISDLKNRWKKLEYV